MKKNKNRSEPQMRHYCFFSNRFQYRAFCAVNERRLGWRRKMHGQSSLALRQSNLALG
jgi:hypothetical protein